MKHLVAAVLLFAPSVARAHIMPEGQGSTRLVGKNGYTLVGVSAKALAAYDDDRDGLISREELSRHGAAIDSMLRVRVRLYSEKSEGRITWQTLSLEHSDVPDAPVPSVTMIRVSEWDEAPVRLRVESTLGAPVAFRAIIGERTETDTLSARRTEVTFFAPRRAIATTDLALIGLLVTVAPVAFLLKRKTRG